jgi:carboxyl-terminal processing protease
VSNDGGRGGFGPGVVIGLIAGVAIAAIVGVLTGYLDFNKTGDESIVQARSVIEDNYFHDPNRQRLDDASISGMVDSLKKRYDDKFSSYFTADQLQSFEEQTSGRFAGVGLSVSEVPKGLRVAVVFPDTPAERAGIKVGDLIVAVDGKSIAGLPSEASTARIKGPIGTDVELTVVPAGGGKPNQIKVQRASVRIPAVDGTLMRDPEGEKIAYVAFHIFSQGAHGELLDEIERLRRRGAEGLVLDLRDNGGGLLNEAVLCASIFQEDGNVVSTRSRTQGDKDYAAVGDSIEPQPMVVLTTRNTASAAEILSATLQQHDLAEIVGTRTYGKGTFQEVSDLPAGGALKLTIGEYLTADGTSILGKGVKPDVRVVDDPRTESTDEAVDRGLAVVGRQVSPTQP